MSKPKDMNIHTPWKMDGDEQPVKRIVDSRKNVVMEEDPLDCAYPRYVIPRRFEMEHICNCINACGELDPKHVAELLSNCEELLRKIDALGYSKSDNMQVKELLDLIDYYLDTPIKKARGE